MRSGEETLPEDEPAPANAAPAAPSIDEAIVAQLAEMGFPIEGCKKAVFNTQNAGT